MRRLAALAVREWNIRQGTLLFIGAFLVSAVLGIIRQALFNAQFGAGGAADAYYAAFRLPETIGNLIAGGALSNAMIPVLIAARDVSRANEERVVRLVFSTLTTVALVGIIIGMICAPWFVTRVLAPGFDAATADLTVGVTRLLLLQLLFGIAGAAQQAVLNSRSQFLLPALVIMGSNPLLIAGILAARALPQLGVYGPALGVVGDGLVQLLILLPGMQLNRIRLGFVWDLHDVQLREVLRLLLPSGGSATINYAGGIIDTAFASLARAAAGLAAISNSILLVGLPIRLLGIALAQAAFPQLAAHAEHHNWRAMQRTLGRSLAASVGLTIPSALVFVLLGRWIIQILFERGRFDATAGDLTYALLVIYALGLPAYVATEVLTRALVALRDTLTPLVTNIGQIIGRALIISTTLTIWDVGAIPAAFAITCTIEALILGAVVWWKIQRRLRQPAPDLA